MVAAGADGASRSVGCPSISRPEGSEPRAIRLNVAALRRFARNRRMMKVIVPAILADAIVTTGPHGFARQQGACKRSAR